MEVVNPKQAGKRALGLSKPVFDEKAVERADLAMEVISQNFREWLDKEVSRTQSARVAAQAAGWSHASLDELNLCAHDLKGLAATYGYPLITSIAASLCRLIETDAGKAIARTQPDLVEAHVDAARAAQRDRIKSVESPVGRALLAALEARVDALGVAPR
jgi:chemotaxis protein histidine kinase CheA